MNPLVLLLVNLCVIVLVYFGMRALVRRGVPGARAVTSWVPGRIVGILLIVLVLYQLILASHPAARSLGNHQNLAFRVALFGVLSLGVGVLIISGGIDLSIGSVFGLSAVSLGVLLNNKVPSGLAVLIVLALGCLIGLFHGLLVTRLRLQPFIVTLCGLFVYRGIARWLAIPGPKLVPIKAMIQKISGGAFFGNERLQVRGELPVGIGAQSEELKDLIYWSNGFPHLGNLSDVPGLGPLVHAIECVPVRFWLLVGLALLMALFLHYSVYGRYIFAVGSNEQAARYAGVPTTRYKILPYVLCSMLAAFGGMMELLYQIGVEASNVGTFYELYAITGAVLGGCSLRGGEGTVIGMILGAAVLPLLSNFINMSGIPDALELLVIGLALLFGTIMDEMLKRRAAQRSGP